jgi:staphylococcal nuclease domain-containing protein 1
MRAVVEHVFSGSRFKVLVPKENVAFMLALSAVRCPQVGRDGRAGEPCGDAARTFSRHAILQRGVEVEVVSDSPFNFFLIIKVTVILPWFTVVYHK